MFFSLERRQYSPLNSARRPSFDSAPSLVNVRSRAIINTAVWVPLVLCIFFSGYIAGSSKLYELVSYDKAVIEPDDLPQRPLQVNTSFSGRPDEHKSLAWEKLFPSKGGYFTHPTLSPQEGVFSAFHQLHCVEHIWRHWWAFYDAPEDPHQHSVRRRSHLHHAVEGEHKHDPGQILDPKHMTHCIELIRNLIMCQPDLTVEMKRKDIGGVNGFGTVHTCKSWNDLIEWTSQWE